MSPQFLRERICLKTEIRVNLPDTVGKGYATFWHYKGRYRMLKGGRGKKKAAPPPCGLFTI